MTLKSPLEAHTRSQINLRLSNLKWNLDENSPDCCVFQERAKTEQQTRLFLRKRPDYVLYESGQSLPC